MRSPLTLVVVVSALVALGLSGCGASPVSGPTGSATSSSAMPTIAPTLSPMGTANDNIAYFRAVVEAATKTQGLNASTEKLARTLAAKGFSAKGIEYTDNATAVGMKPDSVTVAVEFKGQCLIAQYGPSIKGIAVSVLPVLASGGCLLGRSINHL